MDPLCSIESTLLNQVRLETASSISVSNSFTQPHVAETEADAAKLFHQSALPLTEIFCPQT